MSNTHPEIDITKPIRLTDFGKKQIDNNINLSDARIDSYPIITNGRCFTMTGKLYESDDLPSIENYEPIKQEPPNNTEIKPVYPDTIYLDTLTRRWYVSGEKDAYGVIDGRYQPYGIKEDSPMTDFKYAEQGSYLLKEFGWREGDYLFTCMECEQEAQGAKRCYHCEKCATKYRDAFMNKPKQESQIDKWHSVPDDSTQAATTRPYEIELSQVERMAWELKKSGLTIFDAYNVAQKFLDEVKKRREGKC